MLPLGVDKAMYGAYMATNAASLAVKVAREAADAAANAAQAAEKAAQAAFTAAELAKQAVDQVQRAYVDFPTSPGKEEEDRKEEGRSAKLAKAKHIWNDRSTGNFI